MNLRQTFIISTVMISLFSLPLPASADTHHWVHFKWLADKAPVTPKKVVVLPVDIETTEVTAGGVVEKVPEWSKEASRNVFKAVSAVLAKQGLSEATNTGFDSLSGVINEHIALYKLIVNTTATFDSENNPGWQYKLAHFDYSVGPGLREIANKTGADAAIMVYGRDSASTGGRKALAVVSAITSPFTGVQGPELGHSFIHIGMIDLRTGDLLWMNSNFQKGSTNLRDAGDATKMINTVFEEYPGIDKYRRKYAKQ